MTSNAHSPGSANVIRFGASRRSIPLTEPVEVRRQHHHYSKNVECHEGNFSLLCSLIRSRLESKSKNDRHIRQKKPPDPTGTYPGGTRSALYIYATTPHPRAKRRSHLTVFYWTERRQHRRNTRVHTNLVLGLDLSRPLYHLLIVATVHRKA